MITAPTVVEIAHQRAADLYPGQPWDQHRFLMAFEQARLIDINGGDIDAEWARAQTSTPATAGHIEGRASVRAEGGQW